MNKRDSKELGKYKMYFVASVIAMVALYFLAGPWFWLAIPFVCTSFVYMLDII